MIGAHVFASAKIAAGLQPDLPVEAIGTGAYPARSKNRFDAHLLERIARLG